MGEKIFVVFVFALMLVGLLLVLKEFEPSSKEIYQVTQIIDGDTIKLSNGERVRLIGINTPETDQPYYSEATEKLKELIGDSPVTLKKDVEDKDQYGRLLRYVYVNETFVNLKMVRQGYAVAYHIPPNTKYSDELEVAEQEAITANIGMWTRSNFSVRVSFMHADAEGDDSDNLNDEYVVFENNGTSPLNITEWSVQDKANNFYTFPTFSLVNGSSVTLYSGLGTDTTAQLFWGSTKPIWNNEGDTLYLRDAEGYYVSHFSY